MNIQSLIDNLHNLGFHTILRDKPNGESEEYTLEFALGLADEIKKY